MIFPNKFINFDSSILSKMLCILDYKKNKEINISTLYNETKEEFKTIDEFMYSLDVLYILNYIDIDFNNGVLSYVEKN